MGSGDSCLHICECVTFSIGKLTFSVVSRVAGGPTTGLGSTSDWGLEGHPDLKSTCLVPALPLTYYTMLVKFLLIPDLPSSRESKFEPDGPEAPFRLPSTHLTHLTCVLRDPTAV